MLVKPLSSRPSTSNPAQSHPAVCTDCGTTTTVPFRPIQGKPVYCRPCFQAYRSVPSSTVNEPVNRKLTSVDYPPVDSAPDGVSAFPENAFEGRYQEGNSPDEHIGTHTDSGGGHPKPP